MEVLFFPHVATHKTLDKMYGIFKQKKIQSYFHGLVQDCSNSSVVALELQQYCTKAIDFMPENPLNGGYCDFT